MRIISGKYGRRRFDVPTNISARPTTDFARENIFNVITNVADIEGANVLDLFAGTGAVSFEFLSREAASVTSVEKAATQFNFIRKVATLLGADNHKAIKGDVKRFIASQKGSHAYDIIFADPPYDMPDFDDVAMSVIDNGLLRPGALFILEHSGKHDYSSHPLFSEHRAYGSVNFTLFRAPAEEQS